MLESKQQKLCWRAINVYDYWIAMLSSCLIAFVYPNRLKQVRLSLYSSQHKLLAYTVKHINTLFSPIMDSLMGSFRPTYRYFCLLFHCDVFHSGHYCRQSR